MGEANPCTTSTGGAGTCCSGLCVDLATRNDACGSCNNACPVGTTCAYGQCASPGGTIVGGCGSECPAGTECGESPYGSQCLSSTCTMASEGDNCFVGGSIGTCCGLSCVDLQSDANNCLFCFASCGEGETCSNGACSGGCPAGTVAFAGSSCIPTTCHAAAQGQLDCAGDGGTIGTCCGDACVDTQSDPHNCQVCGNVCPAGSFCNNGFCPVVDCRGAPLYTQCMLGGGADAGVGACCGDTCVDQNTSVTACGGCGVVCPSGGSCVQGVCNGPDGGFFECSDDPSGCPAGSACSGILCIASSCAGAPDGQSCAFGPGGGGGACCGGKCVDPTTDPENCGGCGIGSATSTCVGGFVFPPAADAGTCPPCPAELTCLGPGSNTSNGPYCYTSQCGLAGGLLCLQAGGSRGACCFGGDGWSCTSFETDPANCGACGVACPSGQSCDHGTCSGTAPSCAGRVNGYCDLDAGPGFVCCAGGGCTNTLTDPNNCGGCGIGCDGGTCSGGACNGTKGP